MLLRRTLLVALVAALLLPLGSAHAASVTGGAGLPTLLHEVATSGGADVGSAPAVKPKPRARPKHRHNARPKHWHHPRRHRAKHRHVAKRHPKSKLDTRPRPQPAPGAGVFPVRGAFNFGGSDARFGAPRHGHIHQGQDVLAAEGTPLVAPVSGTVSYTAYQAAAAGYYVVIHGGDGRDYVLMHLRHPTTVPVGASVRCSPAQSRRCSSPLRPTPTPRSSRIRRAQAMHEARQRRR